MGLTEFEAKRALAEKSASRAHCVELLQLIRREKMRAPRAVATFGKVLIDKHSWGLGNELWNVYEQVFIAALDLHDDELAEVRWQHKSLSFFEEQLTDDVCVFAIEQQCLKALKDKFPGSSRVARLEGMQLEQRGEYAKAEALYAEVLEENPANMLVAKRKIAVLKAQKRTHDVIAALNDFLRSFGTDLSAWTELAETYLSLGAFRYASFCYEELVLLNPMDAIYHSRLADIYSTLGGLDNLRTARKHYSHSIELNKQQNLRAYLGLVACTKAIASHRNYRADQDDNGLNERLLQFALDFLQQFYASQATPELAEVAQRALSSF